MPASGAEMPEFQPLPAQLTGLWRKRRDLAARAASDGLRVALPGLAGRWVEIVLSNDPAEGRDTLPDISFVGPDGRPGTVLPQEARGSPGGRAIADGTWRPSFDSPGGMG